MAINVLVVDDSNFICRQVAQILSSDPGIKVVGVAHNGQEALHKVKQLKPDLVTLDVEMPVMDGITALKAIMKEQPTKVLMLSSLTYEGAKLTLDALEFGAVDFMLKSYEGISQGNSKLARDLITKVKEIGGGANVNIMRQVQPATPPQPSPPKEPTSATKPPVSQSKPTPRVAAPSSVVSPGRYRLIAVGASTGGPVVVQSLLSQLPANYPLPIIVAQHMPATFTGAFSQRVNSLAKLSVVEASDGMSLRAGHAYIAPGGKQMYLEGRPENATIRIRETDGRLPFAPCVDVTYASAAKVYRDKVLAVVLTGMGSDGRDGAKLLKQAGSTVWTQDEASCVVYGMPMSVKTAGLSDRELPGMSFASELTRLG